MKTNKTLIQFKDLTNQNPNNLNDEFVNEVFSKIDYEFNHDSKFDELFKKLFNKYYNSIICELSFLADFETSPTKIACSYWMNSIIEVYNETYEKYETIIDIYKDSINRLMDMVKATNTSKIYVNDTPQNEGGVFEETTFTSQFSKNENVIEDEKESKIDRIRKIQDSLKNLWREWLHEFRQCFIELNIEVEGD